MVAALLAVSLGAACSSGSGSHVAGNTSSTATAQIASGTGSTPPSASATTREETGATAKVDAYGRAVTTTTPTNVPTTLVAASPPASESGRGAIFGHVYASCGQPGMGGGACQSQSGVAGVAMVAQSGGREVSRTETAADGTYRLEVAPGSYVVHETRDGQTASLRVETGRTVVANFTLT